MVQNMSVSSPNQNGARVQRLGMSENGRVIYQVYDTDGSKANALSVAQRDCDVFEKSFKDMMEAAPSIERYARTTTPEQMKKQQSLSKWVIAGCTGLGALIPMIKTKGGWIKQTLFTVGGAIAGLAAGMGISYAAFSPPGAAKMAKATQNIKKLDIQPL